MNNFRLLLAVFLSATVFCGVLPAAALELGGHDRDGTVVGLTFGHGWNSIEYTRDGITEKTSNVSAFTGGARIGWAPSDHFIGSIGFYGWRRSYYTVTPVSAYTFSFILEGYWFPRGEGFWIKGGVGRGTLDFYAKAPLEINSIIFQESGWTYSTGAGYEFRVSDGAGIGLSYDLIYINVGDFSNFTSTKSISHNLSLNLHFYIM